MIATQLIVGRYHLYNQRHTQQSSIGCHESPRSRNSRIGRMKRSSYLIYELVFLPHSNIIHDKWIFETTDNNFMVVFLRLVRQKPHLAIRRLLISARTASTFSFTVGF